MLFQKFLRLILDANRGYIKLSLAHVFLFLQKTFEPVKTITDLTTNCTAIFFTLIIFFYLGLLIGLKFVTIYILLLVYQGRFNT